MNVLEVINIQKAFGDHKVLRGIDFSIEQPQILALVGPNGSGKSTLFNIITNLLKADKGQVKIFGIPNTNPDVFYKTAFLKDNTALYGYLTGRDHLKFIRNMQKLPLTRVDELVDMMNLESYIDNTVETYSLGMKQHLLLAMVLMNDPDLIILDEPLTGLDPTSIIRIRNLLGELNKEGKTILLSSHTLSEIDHITSNILFLKEGKVLKEDISIYNRIEYEIKLRDPIETKKIKELLESNKELSIKGSTLHYITRTKDENIEKLMKQIIELNIPFSSISRDKIGAENRYRNLFPEINSKNLTGEIYEKI